jgi:hypothetical protein
MYANTTKTREAHDRAVDAADGGGILKAPFPWFGTCAFLLRIALCGYEGEHTMPDSWECIAWKANGGYATSQENSAKERIWFSPHCISGKQGSLFA